MEENIIKEIHLISIKQILTENDRNKLSLLQSKLDKIYERKARGAFIGSRSKLIEEGQKNPLLISVDWKKDGRRGIQLKHLQLIMQTGQSLN